MLKPKILSEGLNPGIRNRTRGKKDFGRAELVQAIKTEYEGESLVQPVIANRLVERMAIDEAASLSERQQEVLQLLASGPATRTVKFHVENLYRNLGVRTWTEAMRVARERNILPD